VNGRTIAGTNNEIASVTWTTRMYGKRAVGIWSRL
jgi:hypothetical protein